MGNYELLRTCKCDINYIPIIINLETFVSMHLQKPRLQNLQDQEQGTSGHHRFPVNDSYSGLGGNISSIRTPSGWGEGRGGGFLH